ncbi:patatin-like phospholipase family protein [Actinomadura rubrisoli]|uniref:patatin-like phospholipase family protein n=1 Tax=Actinomadura rubrisoli TaxID=2530368 RepID=UPI001404EEE1|nr:patatin-like phospholipase family protein [Actinomadura rubrisoli]
MAFVLGGGGVLGAHQTGMLSALLLSGIRPDLVVGVSSGALHGAVLAADPTLNSLITMRRFWHDFHERAILHRCRLERVVSTLAPSGRRRTSQRFRRLVEEHLAAERFEELAIPFHCMATDIGAACERWFARGPLLPAVLASTAVPALMETVSLDGVQLADGGLVNSLPVDRAVTLGARTLYVMQTTPGPGSTEIPDHVWEWPSMALNITQRYRVRASLEAVPEDVTVHVLPTGISRPEQFSVQRQIQTAGPAEGIKDAEIRIERSYLATQRYLWRHGLGS